MPDLRHEAAIKLIAMVIEAKVHKIGDWLGVILPPEALIRLGVAEGDTVVLIETGENGIQIHSPHGDFSRKMEVVDDLSRRYQNALTELSG